jgi:cytochrome c551
MRTIITVVGALFAALVVSACGGSSSDSSKGPPLDDAARSSAQDLFKQSCGGCHQLDDAGTSGGSGPPLSGGSYGVDRVASQIERGGGGMPPGLLDGKDKDAVARYVAEASSE